MYRIASLFTRWSLPHTRSTWSPDCIGTGQSRSLQQQRNEISDAAEAGQPLPPVPIINASEAAGRTALARALARDRSGQGFNVEGYAGLPALQPDQRPFRSPQQQLSGSTCEANLLKTICRFWSTRKPGYLHKPVFTASQTMQLRSR